MEPRFVRSDDSAARASVSLTPFFEELSALESLAFLELARKVFASPRRYGFASGDEAAEAFVRYKRRLISIVKRAGTIAGGREAYVDSCLRYLAKSVQRTLRRQGMIDSILENAGEIYCAGLDFAEHAAATAAEPEPGNEHFIASVSPSRLLMGMEAPRKRMLYLALKCAWETDDALAAKVAARLGVPLPWLSAMLHQARSTLEPARLSVARLNERINALWLRARIIESELRGEDARPERREKLLRAAAQCRSRYMVLLARKARFRLLVSNRAIAEILRIPKGTVDSGLFYFKESLAMAKADGSGAAADETGAAG
ncbi:hypothetical protein LWX53_09425 [bacterium]|nr:hypothetical protein [bacterium]